LTAELPLVSVFQANLVIINISDWNCSHKMWH